MKVTFSMSFTIILNRYNNAAYIALRTNKEVQQALCKPIDDNNYNANIKAFINAVNWLADDAGKGYAALYPLDKHIYNSDIEHIKKCAICAAIAHQESSEHRY